MDGRLRRAVPAPRTTVSTTALGPEVLERVQAAVRQRVYGLAGAARSLESATAEESLRLHAADEAHRLAGLGGLVGLPRVSELAREMQQLLTASRDAPTTAAAFRELADALVREIERRRAPAVAAHALSPRPVILIANTGPTRAAAIATAVDVRGLRSKVVRTLSAARDAARRVGPAVVIVGMADAPSEELTQLLADLRLLEPAPVVLAALGSAGTAERLAAVRAGAHGVLDDSLSVAQIAEAVVVHVPAPGWARGKVLVVDDDDEILESVRHVLENAGLQVATLTDPERFWEVLVEAAPDLVILDIAMPGVDGLEVCTLVRADPRWRSLPVLFLSVADDAESIRRVFEVGGDDFVGKPFVGPELLARVTSRLERMRLQRLLVDTDPLTGLGNRRRLATDFVRLREQSDRHGRPLSLVVVDVDRFKQVNDMLGHEVGDSVLQRLAGHLLTSFREGDIIARIGGDEFIVCLGGIPGEVAVARVSSVLARFRDAGVPLEDGTSILVGASCGGAEYPRDGDDFETLYRRADRALLEAKRAARAAVPSDG
jgi:diguanylate cyclase (GGDEF)-like protein